ncbi:hypothetical protein WJX72_007352 [[Myrmecia] bisecta]|uniref:Uncharacterized protein n=1 Tax=[Myrmecia] bisecta TaxID=41462 RepID=A0AAW1Q492_9CHLO
MSTSPAGQLALGHAVSSSAFQPATASAVPAVNSFTAGETTVEQPSSNSTIVAVVEPVAATVVSPAEDQQLLLLGGPNAPAAGLSFTTAVDAPEPPAAPEAAAVLAAQEVVFEDAVLAAAIQVSTKQQPLQSAEAAVPAVEATTKAEAGGLAPEYDARLRAVKEAAEARQREEERRSQRRAAAMSQLQAKVEKEPAGEHALAVTPTHTKLKAAMVPLLPLLHWVAAVWTWIQAAAHQAFVRAFGSDPDVKAA